MALLLFWCGLMLAVVPHELGHAAAARLAGVRILGINIGAGPLLFRRRLAGGGWLLVRAVFLSGSLEYVPPLRPRRLAEGITLIGGAVGNLGLFALLAGMAAAGWLSSEAAQQLAFPQLLMVVLNLMPFSGRYDGRRVRSDGAQLLELLRRRSRPVTEGLLTMIRLYVPEAVPADLSPATPVIGLMAARLLTEQEGWMRQDAAAFLVQLLDGTLTKAERVVVLSLLAEAEIAQGGIGAEWDAPAHWTHELMHISATPTTYILRGAALTRSGSPVEGQGLLGPLMAQGADPVFAIKSCFYAACTARSDGALIAADVAVRRAGDIAQHHNLAFDKVMFQAAVDMAPTKPRRVALQRPGTKLTRAGLAAALLLTGCLSAAVAGSLASRAGERRGYLAACDEREAARVFSRARPSGVECGR